MAESGDEPVRKSAVYEIGAGLDDLPVVELDLRIEILRQEIIRLERAKVAKQDALKRASSFFKS